MKRAPGLHAYYPPQFDDARSPCPALNALANHNYLPRNGRNINAFTAGHVLREVYSLSWLLAVVVTLAACYCSKSFTFNLADLCQHNVLEHDASLAHADATGALAPAEPDRIAYGVPVNHSSRPNISSRVILVARSRESITMFSSFVPHSLATYS